MEYTKDVVFSIDYEVDHRKDIKRVFKNIFDHVKKQIRNNKIITYIMLGLNCAIVVDLILVNIFISILKNV